MGKVKEGYVLTALEDFSCMADKCSRSCCSRFSVSLNPETHLKWQSLASTDADKAWLLSGVSRPKDVGNVELTVATKENSADCLFLRQDRLCSIHAELGAEFLPAICRDYPRSRATPPGREIVYATLSCPEICRLVLFDDAKPVFRRVKGDGCDVPAEANERVALFLHDLLGDLLSAQEYPLNLRLVYLARVLSEIMRLSEMRQLSNRVLGNIAARFKENMQGLTMAVQNGQFATKPINGLNMWDFLREGTLRFKLFEECGLPDDMPILQFAIRADTDAEAKSLFYRELMSHRQRNRKQLRQHERAFARYLESRLVSQGFPYAYHAYQQNFIASFLASVCPLAIIQMLLWLRISLVPQLTENEIVDIVVRVEENFFHNDALLKALGKSPLLLRIGGYHDWFLEVT